MIVEHNPNGCVVDGQGFVIDRRGIRSGRVARISDGSFPPGITVSMGGSNWNFPGADVYPTAAQASITKPYGAKALVQWQREK